MRWALCADLACPLVAQSLVFETHDIRAIGPFEPSDREMAAGDGLEVLDKGEIDRGAADGADHRQGLSGDLFADHHAETRRDLGDEPDQDRRRLVGEAVVYNETRAIADCLGERAADREILALQRSFAGPVAAEREDFDAGE